VTDGQWLSSTEPTPMLDFLQTSGKLSERKARLFAVACCRHIWTLSPDWRTRKAVEVAERHADGEAMQEESGAVHVAAEACSAEAEAAANDAMRAMSHGDYVWYAARAAASFAARAAVRTAAAQAREAAEDCVTAASATCTASLAAHWWGQEDPAAEAERASIETTARHFQCDVVRDIFGNPFAAAPQIDPAWLTWNNGTVKRLAEAAYQERLLPQGTLDPARLAVLADALEEAGCGHGELLGHLRGRGPHLRGCWAVDLLSGRERGPP
jgi:hypothetical protein